MLMVVEDGGGVDNNGNDDSRVMVLKMTLVIALRTLVATVVVLATAMVNSVKILEPATQLLEHQRRCEQTLASGSN